MLRTHTCGELSAKDIGKKVTLAGWSHTRRDHGGIIFIDLRDRYGLSQIVFDPAHKKKVHAQAEHIGREWVLQISGKVRRRPKDMENPKLKTGQIEVLVDDLKILGKSEVPPLEIDDRIEAGEEIRLKYRYLDLRRPIMQKRLLIRAAVAKAVRDFLTANSFIEVEMPTLVKSTPEGARDYIVPSRINPGKFYALPQSPQLYKQILMVAGFDRYFSIAKCFRDEDLRTDRQPEHSQIDLEMSFVEADDVIKLVESLCAHIFKAVLGAKLETPFQKMTYEKAVNNYGTDKPDLRYDYQIKDVTKEAKDSDFKVFKEAETVRSLLTDQEFSRKEIDSLIGWSQEQGAAGLAWAKVNGKALESSISKYLPEKAQTAIIKKTGAKNGIIFFIADKKTKSAELMGLLRQEIAKRKKLIDNKKFAFCWVVDFPLYEKDEETGRWVPEHHVFSSPTEETISFLQEDPGKVKGKLYDLVLNGVELGSGSIRITDPELQKKVLQIIGVSEKETEQKFGFLLEAFRFGAPPHGGIGIGFDRTVALMQGLHDIREVIPFPKNKKAEFPMDGSPSEVDPTQLRELHIKTLK